MVLGAVSMRAESTFNAAADVIRGPAKISVGEAGLVVAITGLTLALSRDPYAASAAGVTTTAALRWPPSRRVVARFFPGS